MDNKYTAVIVEPRKFPSFEFVLDNFLTNLNDEWNFIIYCGLKNQSWVENIIDSKFSKYKYKITIKQLGVDNLTIDDYNNLMTNINFINEIPTEIFLIFQTDTIICENGKDLINNYLKYDYVGAPWPTGEVGNGGLSLRRKSKILEILKKCPPRIPGMNEDSYYSRGCDQVNIYKPTTEQAILFSIEQVYSPISFGVHKPWLWLGLESISKQCKNYEKLYNLNLQPNIENFNNFSNNQYNYTRLIILILILILIVIIIKNKH